MRWRHGLHGLARLGASAVAVAAGTAAAVEPCEDATPEVAVARVNAQRAQTSVCAVAAAPLSWQPRLAALAAEQAAWMAENGQLQHSGRNGRTLSQRARQAGYAYARINENLALGQRRLAQALQGWVASPSHCANLYDAWVTEVGVACVPGADGRPYWVLIAGRPAAQMPPLSADSRSVWPGVAPQPLPNEQPTHRTPPGWRFQWEAASPASAVTVKPAASPASAAPPSRAASAASAAAVDRPASAPARR